VSKEAQAAAEEYQNAVLGLVGYTTEPPGWDEAFLAGVTWTLAQHPKVLALLETLTCIRDNRMHDSHVSKLATEALAAFRDGKGEK
jgi:hypothetical protein